MKRHIDRLTRLVLVLLFLTACSVALVARADDTAQEPAEAEGGFGEQAVEIARSYEDGGGYIWKKSTGVSETLVFGGKTVLKKQPTGTYCSGFTFQVAFKLAEHHGLFDGKNFDEVKRFQRQWYGATEESGEEQCTFAMQELGIGQPVNHDDARPGDFANYWRTKSGHSVIFLNWVTDDEGNRTGIHYRSSQTKTDGIGDRTEFFKGHGGHVDPERLYLCRFNEPESDDEQEKPRRGANR